MRAAETHGHDSQTNKWRSNPRLAAHPHAHAPGQHPLLHQQPMASAMVNAVAASAATSAVRAGATATTNACGARSANGFCEDTRRLKAQRPANLRASAPRFPRQTHGEPHTRTTPRTYRRSLPRERPRGFGPSARLLFPRLSRAGTVLLTFNHSNNAFALMSAALSAHHPAAYRPETHSTPPRPAPHDGQACPPLSLRAAAPHRVLRKNQSVRKFAASALGHRRRRFVPLIQNPPRAFTRAASLSATEAATDRVIPATSRAVQVSLLTRPAATGAYAGAGSPGSPDLLDELGTRQGLTLVHFPAQLEPCLSQANTLHTLNAP